MYNALPHLRHKVVTNNHDAATVLKWAVFEMNRRYELLQANGARNLADFNRKVRGREAAPASAHGPARRSPTISAEAPDTPPRAARARDVHRGRAAASSCIIIDELADLMMTVQARGRDAARAAGAEGARDRHPPDPRDPAPVGERHHRPHQGQLPEPDRVPGGVARWTAAPSSTRTAPRRCSATATCCSCRPGRASRCGSRARTSRTEETEKLMEWYAARREARRAALQTAERTEADILEVIRAQEAEGEGGAGTTRRRRARRALPRGGRGLHPEPGRLHVAAAAPAADRLRAGGAHHRPAPRGGDSRPAGREQAAGGADRVRPAGRVLQVQ